MSEASSESVAEVSGEPQKPAQTGRGWRRGARGLLGLLTFAYVFVLFVLLGALEWWGERHWLLSVALYAPPLLFLAPLGLLTPLALVFRRGLIGWHLFAAFVVIFGYMTFRWRPPTPPTAQSLTAVTFNAGQSSTAQFLAFLETEQPDLILLQDAMARPVRYDKLFPQSSIRLCGEFMLISKYPIQAATILHQPNWNGLPVGARFEVLIRGETLVLYNIRLPTPRSQLRQFLDPRAVDQLLSEKERAHEFASYREWIDFRVNFAGKLANTFAEERQPYLVAGDFNTPDHGYIYHLFANTARDAFADSGRGWCFTFPGHTRPIADWLAPWLRLDYFFVGRGWRATECRPERGRRSEHRAVFARFEPVK